MSFLRVILLCFLAIAALVALTCTVAATSQGLATPALTAFAVCGVCVLAFIVTATRGNK